MRSQKRVSELYKGMPCNRIQSCGLLVITVPIRCFSRSPVGIYLCLLTLSFHSHFFLTITTFKGHL